MRNSRLVWKVWIVKCLVLFFLLPHLGLSQNTTNHISILKTYPNRQSNTYELNRQALSFLLDEAPNQFTTELLDRNGAPVIVILSKVSFSKYDFLQDLYYQGQLMDTDVSLVTMSINTDGIKGLISNPEGNYYYNSSFNEQSSLNSNLGATSAETWTCNSDTQQTRQTKSALEKENKESGLDYNSLYNNKEASHDTIGIYFVCDYKLYTHLGSSKASVISYVHEMFSQVYALYSLADIEIKISDILIWDTPDPYDKSTNQKALIDFRSKIGPNFDGHFAHLLTMDDRLSGGIAYVNSLCNRNKAFAMSKVNGNTNYGGSYSWDVHVVAHEIGHNIGSPHTHDCAWGADGTSAIDACGQVSQNCEGAPIPQQGGTLMSYCHNNPVGVNFSLGFGAEPSQLLRDKIAACAPSEGYNCSKATTLSSDGTYSISDISQGGGAQNNQASHARWYTFTAPTHGWVTIGSCGQSMDTRLWLYSGSCEDLSLLDQSDDDCISGGGYNYASEIKEIFIEKGSVIFVEWDDRWSHDGFDFSFSFVQQEIETCSNGIIDGDETDIDCGGSCEPCASDCESTEPLDNMINQSLTFIDNSMISYNGTIAQTGSLTMLSQTGVELHQEFEIESGGSLQIQIGNCEDL